MGFGERLRARREELHISRAELAERLGVSRSAIGNYETGVSFPKEDVLLRLFDALNVDPNYLYRDSFKGASDVMTIEEQRLLKKYRALPKSGRSAVDTVVDVLSEYKSADVQEVGEQEGRVIPLYRSPAAAGYAAPVCGDDFDNIPVTATTPDNAQFAVRIQGDSMIPYIRDNSIVYVNREPLGNGDVGIFCVDGDMLCKQYYKDRLGIVYLFSLNRARADADVVFGADSGRTLACFGRVIMKAPLLPGKM